MTNLHSALETAYEDLDDAKYLLAGRRIKSACSRAYYAIFYAAKAAILLSRAKVPPNIAKTHNGLISLFGNHVIKTNLVPKELGQIISWAENIRLLADYDDGSAISLEVAEKMVKEAEIFVDTISTLFDARKKQ